MSIDRLDNIQQVERVLYRGHNCFLMEDSNIIDYEDNKLCVLQVLFQYCFSSQLARNTFL